jgi:hypothetical protein
MQGRWRCLPVERWDEALSKVVATLLVDKATRTILEFAELSSVLVLVSWPSTGYNLRRKTSLGRARRLAGISSLFAL